jgi:ribonuclease-3
MASDNDLKTLMETIGYSFRDETLLIQALTHSSYANERREKISDYERLEFLGDAVLEMIVSDALFKEHPDLREGELTKKRAALVCEPSLAYCAKKIGLCDYIFLGKGEEAAGGRERVAIISDVLEAVLGAVYLDGGYDAAERYVREIVLKNQESLRLFHDSKTMLQELVQGRKLPPLSYRIVGERGPEHRRIFTCEALIGDKVMGSGEGTSKKAAEQNAAYQALLALEDRS